VETVSYLFILLTHVPIWPEVVRYTGIISILNK